MKKYAYLLCKSLKIHADDVAREQTKLTVNNDIFWNPLIPFINENLNVRTRFRTDKLTDILTRQNDFSMPNLPSESSLTIIYYLVI